MYFQIRRWVVSSCRRGFVIFLESRVESIGHLKRTRVARGGIAVVAALALLCLWAVPAQALVVIMDIGWGYYGNSDMDNDALRSNFALQEGSIVQVIAYDSTAYPDNTFTGGNPVDNFDVFGAYAGTPIPGEPNYSPNDQPPSENNVYSPYTAPEGHLIAYTTTIGPAIGGNANGYNWYSVYATFQILDSYDSIYIRVFGATEFPLMTTVASYWGISDVQSGGGSIGTWYVTYDDVTAADHVNYFEVIPEPGSLALFALGGAGLLAARRRRLKLG